MICSLTVQTRILADGKRRKRQLGKKNEFLFYYESSFWEIGYMTQVVLFKTTRQWKKLLAYHIWPN